METVNETENITKNKEGKRIVKGKGNKRFIHKELGFNYRMTNIQAAICLAQLEKIDSLLNGRKENSNIYRKHFSKCKNIDLSK
mgnify:CR=1 FL=1